MISKIIKIFSGVIVFLVAISVCIVLFSNSINIFVVGSGSMQPTLKVYDMIVTNKSNQYKMNDIVTFVDKTNTVVTHRIVGISEDGYVTRGDANNLSDKEPLSVENIIGKPIITIPKVGYIYKFFYKIPFCYRNVIILILVFTVTFYISYTSDSKKSR